MLPMGQSVVLEDTAEVLVVVVEVAAVEQQQAVVVGMVDEEKLGYTHTKLWRLQME
jgi:hypothetical protein